MSRVLHRLGGFAARHPWRVIGAWLAAAVVILGLAGSVGGTLNDDYVIPGTSSQRAYDLLQDKFPAFAGADARVVVHTEHGTLDQSALHTTRQRLSDTVDHVSQVAPAVVSQDGATAVITVQYDVPVTDFKGDAGLVALEDATADLTQQGYQVDFGGQMPENIASPGGTAELVGIGLALLILFLAFGSFVAAGLPIGVALVGLGIGSGGVTLLAAMTDVTTIAPTLASMIGIGVGVDYALFIVTRHRDALARGLSVPDAAAEATATAGQSVFFAGGTVLLALSGLLFTGVPNFRAMGYAPGLVVLLIVAASVTLLPALLGLAGMRVYSRKARRTAHLEAAASHSPTAARWAHAVASRPVAWMLGSTVLLLALAAPALGMKLGNADAGNEAESTTIRQAYDLVADGFGPGANAPLLVALDVDKVGGAAGIDALTDELAATRGVGAVSPAQLSPDGSAAVVTVTPTHGPQDDATIALLDRIRAELPEGAELGGFTPGMTDFTDRLSANLWKIVAVVLAASFVLMVLAFRSIVVPVKAALVNLLSIGAAYGVITMAFQTDRGAHLLGLPDSVPIAPYVPVLMFAILFGLSMDYEVFLLSRVREEYLRTGDSRGSVVAGLSSTARVITSAALIMVAVFLGFALDPGVAIKMIGIGLATAIAVDATVVRLVLVPATMALLGARNWYLPAWLDRVLPNVDPHGSAGVGIPEIPEPRQERVLV
jgi:putative drug exporter of the RND superfamily